MELRPGECQHGDMRLLLLAPPGAGKGTQAQRLSKHFGIEHISTGELLRQEVAAGTPIGLAVAEYVKRGDLVPDEIIFALVVDRVIEASRRGGYILDGFPRNLRQAEQARKVALELGVQIEAAIYIEVSREVAIARLLGRSSDEGRDDDNMAVILHRLEVFERETMPVVAYYQSLGILVQVNGEQPPDQATADILDRLAKLKR